MKATLPKILAIIEQTRSMAEGRRLVIGGNVSVNGVLVTDISKEILVNTGTSLRSVRLKLLFLQQ